MLCCNLYFYLFLKVLSNGIQDYNNNWLKHLNSTSLHSEIYIICLYFLFLHQSKHGRSSLTPEAMASLLNSGWWSICVESPTKTWCFSSQLHVFFSLYGNSTFPRGANPTEQVKLPCLKPSVLYWLLALTNNLRNCFMQLPT